MEVCVESAIFFGWADNRNLIFLDVMKEIQLYFNGEITEALHIDA